MFLVRIIPERFSNYSFCIILEHLYLYIYICQNYCTRIRRFEIVRDKIKENIYSPWGPLFHIILFKQRERGRSSYQELQTQNFCHPYIKLKTPEISHKFSCREIQLFKSQINCQIKKLCYYFHQVKRTKQLPSVRMDGMAEMDRGT